MKIAIFSDTFAPQINGVANTAKNSARALGELGHEVLVYTISKESGQDLTKQSNGLYKVETLPSSAIPIYPGERLALPLGFALPGLRKFKPDIIHVHTPFALGLEGIMGAKILKIPIVGTHHTFFDHYLEHINLDYKWSRKLSWDVTIAFYNRIDLVISPTKSLRDELISNGLTKRVEVLSNSINSQVFQSNTGLDLSGREDLRKKFGISDKSIVYMGRVSYEKDIDEIVMAMTLVLEKIPVAKLMIIGDGPEKEKLVKLASDLKIKDSIIFTGFVQGVSLVEALSANDVFVTASKSENMPLAVLEAMSVGLPIVAISSLGMSEIVEDGLNGFLLNPEDKNKTVNNISEKIIKLLQDDELREKFGNHSKELSNNYSEKEITNKLVGIYKDVINSKK